MVKNIDTAKAQKRIRTSRERNHLLKDIEFKTIDYLCPRIPKWISPDNLTVIGLLGSLIVASSMILATIYPLAILIAVLGFAIQWFGDSLDGRIAYYRNIPRKWYGWVLDINADWISISLIGIGFYFYMPEYKILAFIFVLAYGGSMILSLLQYKVSDQYIIDKGILGPTEMRIVICLVLIIELLTHQALLPFMLIGSMTLISMNVKESLTVISKGDLRDIEERIKKLAA